MPRPRSRVSTATPTPAKRTRSDAELPGAKRALDAETAAIIASRKERAERLGMLSVLPRDVLCLIAPLLCPSDVVTMHALGAPFVEHTRTDIFKRALFASWVTMSLPSMFVEMRRLAAVMSADECIAMFSFANATFECGDRRMLAASAFDPSKVQLLHVTCDRRVWVACMLATGTAVEDVSLACTIAAEYQMFDELAALLKRHSRQSCNYPIFRDIYRNEHRTPALLKTVIGRIRAQNDMFEVAAALLRAGDIDNLNQLLPKMSSNLKVYALVRASVFIWDRPQQVANALCHMLASAELSPDDVTRCIFTLRSQKGTETDQVISLLQTKPHDPARICELYAESARLHEAGRWISRVTDPGSAKRIIQHVSWSGEFTNPILDTIASHPLLAAALPETDLFDKALYCGIDIETFNRFIALGGVIRDVGAALYNAMRSACSAPIVSIIARNCKTSNSVILRMLEMLRKRCVPQECVDALLDSGRVSAADVVCVLCTPASADNSLGHIKEFYQRRNAALFA